MTGRRYVPRTHGEEAEYRRLRAERPTFEPELRPWVRRVGTALLWLAGAVLALASFVTVRGW